jgi:hypothetical protein
MQAYPLSRSFAAADRARASDRRDSYRIVAEGSGAWVESDLGGVALRVHDLSARGAGLRLVEGSLDAVRRTDLTLRLEGHPEFGALLRPVRGLDPSPADGLLGFNVAEIDRSGLSVFSSFLSTLYSQNTHLVGRLTNSSSPTLSIRGASAIRSLLTSRLLVAGHSLQAHYRGGAPALFLKVIQLGPGDAGCLECMNLGAPSGAVADLGAPVFFTFPGFNSISYFTAPVVASRGAEIAVAVPDVVYQTGFRGSPRHVLTGSQVVVRFEHPLLRGTVIEKPIIDISGVGLSFAFSPGADALFPGQRLGRIRIELPEGPVLVDSALRGVERSRTGEPRSIGVEFLRFEDPASVARWLAYLFRNAHATLVDGTPSDVPDYWRTLERSGYLKLVQERRLPVVEKRFWKVWGDVGRSALSPRFILSRSQARSHGTIAASVFCPRTWLLHHFGVDESARHDRQLFFDIVSDIASGVFYMLTHFVELSYYLGIFEAHKPWNDLLFINFLKSLSTSDDYLLEEFGLYRISTAQAIAPGGSETTFRVSELTAELRDALTDRLRSAVSPLEFDAMSYESSEITMERFSEECRALGIDRSRSVFVARRGELLIAVLLAESGDIGANVFGLYNHCRVIFFEPDEPERREILRDLLQVAVTHYRSCAADEFFFLSETTESREFLETLGFEYIENVHRYVGRRSILPIWLNYIRQSFDVLKEQKSRARAA